MISFLLYITLFVIAAVILGIVVEACGWWLFSIVLLVVTLTVSGKDR